MINTDKFKANQQLKNAEGLLRLNLQHFSEGDVTPPTEPPAGSQDGDGDENTGKGESKTFTQEDVNNIASKEAKKAQEKLFKELGIDDFENAKDGFKKFQQWQDEQKTELEKQQDQLKALSTDKDTLSNENQTLKAQLSALKQGVNSEFVEDVVALAERQVNDDVSIDDAIKQVVEKYPHFSNAQEDNQKKPTIVTGGNPTGTKTGDNDPFAAKLAKYK